LNQFLVEEAFADTPPIWFPISGLASDSKSDFMVMDHRQMAKTPNINEWDARVVGFHIRLLSSHRFSTVIFDNPSHPSVPNFLSLFFLYPLPGYFLLKKVVCIWVEVITFNNQGPWRTLIRLRSIHLWLLVYHSAPVLFSFSFSYHVCHSFSVCADSFYLSFPLNVSPDSFK